MLPTITIGEHIYRLAKMRHAAGQSKVQRKAMWLKSAKWAAYIIITNAGRRER